MGEKLHEKTEFCFSAFFLQQQLSVSGGLIIILTTGNPSGVWSHVSLTKFHEQSQEDPQRDLERFPDVLVVEGEDRESFPAGVSLVMRVLLSLCCCWASPRLVVS